MGINPELARWRKALRQELIGRRMAAAAADHAAWSTRIEAALAAGFDGLAGLKLGVCWPFQAEFDARPYAVGLIARGSRLALPAVVAKAAPLEFRAWSPGVPMTTGVYDLPVPVGTATLVPDALLIPVVGIGERGDRLGYGGGFFDRTLASLVPQPLKIALAFELSRVPTTDPQPHDILMDFVVTEACVYIPGDRGLEPLSVERCGERVARLIRARGLPRPG
jgi:5-formyltetrahydrofolate cyclo-ligase